MNLDPENPHIEYQRWQCKGCRLGPCFCEMEDDLEPSICLMLDLDTDEWNRLEKDDDESYWTKI